METHTLLKDIRLSSGWQNPSNGDIIIFGGDGGETSTEIVKRTNNLLTNNGTVVEGFDLKQTTWYDWHHDDI